MDACDDNLQSWFGWLYDIGSKDKPRHLQSQDRLHEILYDDSGLGKANLIKGITRTFAARVAGETISQKFDTVTLKFTLTYIICASCGPTFIFVSEKHIYKNGIVLGNVGYDISCYPTGQLIWAKPEKYGGHYL